MTHILLKHDINPLDFLVLRPAMFIVIATVKAWTERWNVPLEISSMVTDRGLVKAESDTHQRGDGLDLSIRRWPPGIAEKLVDFLNASEELDRIAALTPKTLEPLLAQIHGEGDNRHIHLQTRRNLDNKAIYEFIM